MGGIKSSHALAKYDGNRSEGILFILTVQLSMDWGRGGSFCIYAVIHMQLCIYASMGTRTLLYLPTQVEAIVDRLSTYPPPLLQEMGEFKYDNSVSYILLPGLEITSLDIS